MFSFVKHYVSQTAYSYRYSSIQPVTPGLLSTTLLSPRTQAFGKPIRAEHTAPTQGQTAAAPAAGRPEAGSGRAPCREKSGAVSREKQELFVCDAQQVLTGSYGVGVNIFVILQPEHLLRECEMPFAGHYMTPLISSWVRGATSTNYLPVRQSQAPRCAKVPDAIQREADQERKEISKRVVGGLSRGRTGGKTPQRAHLQKHRVLLLFFICFYC